MSAAVVRAVAVSTVVAGFSNLPRKKEEFKLAKYWLNWPVAALKMT